MLGRRGKAGYAGASGLVFRQGVVDLLADRFLKDAGEEIPRRGRAPHVHVIPVFFNESEIARPAEIFEHETQRLSFGRRETGGWKWPIFQFSYMTLVAYASAFVAAHVIR